MDDGTLDLKKRIQNLEDVEAIRQLKARYFHAIDRRQWEPLSEIFTETAFASYGGKECRGPAEIKAHVSSGTGTRLGTIHNGYNPLIEITGPAQARGTWALLAGIIRDAAGPVEWVSAYYEDEYAKVAGHWKIKKQVLHFLHRPGAPPSASARK